MFSSSFVLKAITTTALSFFLLSPLFSPSVYGMKDEEEGGFAIKSPSSKPIEIEKQSNTLELAFKYDCQGDTYHLEEKFHEAVICYEKAAKLDHPSAMKKITIMGLKYENGHGVPQNHEQAIVYYEKAAAFGCVRAMHRLGRMYENGHGVPQDHEKASTYYEKAAKLDYVPPMVNLDQGHSMKKRLEKQDTFKDPICDEQLPIETFSSQTDLNKFIVKSTINNYQKMNANVLFSEQIKTKSKYWEVRTLLGKSFFVKKRGILLTKALDDLIDKSSNTSFECGTAHLFNTYKTLSFFKLDELVKDIENKDKEFFVPLMCPGIFTTLKNYALNYNFQEREIFQIGELHVNSKEEWKKIKNFEKWLEKLPIIHESWDTVVHKNESLPYKTIEGGAIYQPNVSGMKGPAKGENLFMVDAEEELYYGFGDLFKDGPQKLITICNALAQVAYNQAPDFYVNNLGFPLLELKKQGKFDKRKEGEHALMYLIDPLLCSFLSLEKIKSNINSLK